MQPVPRPKQSGWQALGPDASQLTVRRTGDALPFSDQANADGRTRYEPMSDES